MNSEKECVPNANIDKCAVVLLDVAGTTTSLAFVKETLFKFATDNAQSFLKDNWEDEEIKKAVKLLKDGDTELDVDGAIEVFKKLSGESSDNKGLKTLQGLIYKKGYADSALQAHVFSDVSKAFENWSKERKVAIYSTGSIESQRLLFTHSTEGDLSQYISHYFDQSVGLKTESESYKKIAEELKVKTEEILFINDNVDELKAAKEAGLLPVLVKREGNEEVSEEASKNFTVIVSFVDLSLENPNKRKNEGEIDEIEAPPTKIAKTDEQKNEASTAGSSAEVIKEKLEAVEDKSEAVEDKSDATEESKVVEKKPEAAEDKPSLIAEKQKTKEQSVEAESTDEPMEVDVPEIESKITAVDNKTDSTTENATNATPKEVVDKDIKVADAMETEQPTENAVVEVKTAIEPVVDSKTDTEKLVQQTKKEEGVETDAEKLKKADGEETMETDHKTEELLPKKDVEVASNTASVDVKKNGVDVEILEVEVLEKEIENVEEAVEVVKSKGKNGELIGDSTKITKEAAEDKKDEKNVATEATENKNEAENTPKTNICKTVKETEKTEVKATEKTEVKATEKIEVKETEKIEVKETEKIEVKETKQTAETVKEEKVIEEAIKEQKELKDTGNIQESKDQKPAEAEKSSKETVTISATVEECPAKPKEETVTENCSEETKEPCPKETEEPPAITEGCSEKTKESKETKAEGKVEVSKNDIANNENAVSETVAKGLKDNIEETVKGQENTSESKIGNGSCDLNATAENGEIINGQENGDKKNDETDPEEADIKIKKLETNAGSPAVSVEV